MSLSFSENNAKYCSSSSELYLHILVSTQVVEKDTNQMLHSMLWSIMHGCIVVVMVSITAIGLQTSSQFRRVLKDLHCGVFVSMLEVFLEFGRCTAHIFTLQSHFDNYCWYFFIVTSSDSDLSLTCERESKEGSTTMGGVVNPCSLREIREERHTYNSLVLQHHKIHFYPKFRRLNFALL